MELFLKYHRAGRTIYDIGGNPEAARAAGLRVPGLMPTGRIASVTANPGVNLIFKAFPAAVIGGIALNGGRGRHLGALTRCPAPGGHLDHLDTVPGAVVLDRRLLRRDHHRFPWRHPFHLRKRIGGLTSHADSGRFASRSANASLCLGAQFAARPTAATGFAP